MYINQKINKQNIYVWVLFKMTQFEMLPFPGRQSSLRQWLAGLGPGGTIFDIQSNKSGNMTIHIVYQIQHVIVDQYLHIYAQQVIYSIEFRNLEEFWNR